MGWGGSVGPVRISVWMPRTHVSQAQQDAPIIPGVLQQDVSSRQQCHTRDPHLKHSERRGPTPEVVFNFHMHNGLVCPHSHTWTYIYTIYTIVTTTSSISSYRGNKISSIGRHHNTATNTYKFKSWQYFHWEGWRKYKAFILGYIFLIVL